MTVQESSLSRRNFLQASLAGAALAAVPMAAAAQSAAAAPKADAPAPAAASEALPRRKLGKTGIEVTMLNMGGMMTALSPQYYDMAWSMGIRYFDNADCYLGGNSEKILGQWLTKYPERRKEVFIVTKDHPKGGVKELPAMLDKRLENMKTDHVDAFFIHGISEREYKGSLEWPKSDEFKTVAEQIRKSGKAKFVGFSCHDGQAPQFLQAAADGGFLDLIMVAYNPFLAPTDALRRSFDACDKAGIGLVAMKTGRGFGEVPKRLPDLDKAGLTVRQGLMHAVWSDERIASVCSMIENLSQMKENVEAAKLYKGPLKTAHFDLLRETVVAGRPTMCPNCDGRCREAAGNRELALNDIARFVNYYEKDGTSEAGEWYRGLAAAERDHGGANLEAASRACLANLDFASIVKKADRYFA